jgi:streptomycin 6-kinase
MILMRGIGPADASLTIGRALPGGSAAYVARVRTADGTPAVLKIALPDGGFAARATR